MVLTRRQTLAKEHERQTRAPRVLPLSERVLRVALYATLIAAHVWLFGTIAYNAYWTVVFPQLFGDGLTAVDPAQPFGDDLTAVDPAQACDPVRLVADGWFGGAEPVLTAEAVQTLRVGPGYAVAGLVPTHPWNATLSSPRAFVDAIARFRRPVVLRGNSPLDRGWLALSDPAREWTAAYLTREVRTFRDVTSQPATTVPGGADVFWYAEPGRRWHNPADTFGEPLPLSHPTTTIPTMSAADFFARLNADEQPPPTDGSVLQAIKYSGEVHASFRHVIRDLRDRMNLSVSVAADVDAHTDAANAPPPPPSPADALVDAAAEAAPDPAARSSTYVWVGGERVTSQTHYDPTHNLYVQLSGTKRFVLSPPTAVHAFYVHPLEHASDRQSQVDHERVGAAAPKDPLRTKTFPRFGSAPAYVADLRKGDVLYLPPYWMHRVSGTSRAPSVSVNVWTDSREGDLLPRLIAVAQPLLTALSTTPDTDPFHQRLELRAFLHELVTQLLRSGHFDDAQGVAPYQSSTSFFAALGHTRYGPLWLSECSASDLVNSGERCDGFDRATPHAVVAAHVRAQPTVAALVRAFDRHLGSSRRSGGRAARWRRVATRGVAEIVAGSFVEHAVHSILGLSRTCSFLRGCMTA